jgi:hypothetical protein
LQPFGNARKLADTWPEIFRVDPKLPYDHYRRIAICSLPLADRNPLRQWAKAGSQAAIASAKFPSQDGGEEMATPQTYSIPALARELQVDARRLGRALAGVRADATTLGGGKRWSKASALAALHRHGHSFTGSTAPRTNGDGRGNGGSDLDRTIDDLEDVGQRLEAAFVELEAVPDLEKRRATQSM